MEHKESVSILVTAFHAQEFIEDCLNSIDSQTYFQGFKKYEILVGIDGCEETLNQIQKIRKKYRNLSVYFMSENKGTYITTNTLISLAKYDCLIRFDSDDIMKPWMVAELMNGLDDTHNQIRCSCDNVDKNGNYEGNDAPVYPDGVCLWKKEVFDKLGGYMSWKCAADTEFIKRGRHYRIIKTKTIEKRLFFRRIHSHSLTKHPDTGRNSNIRKSYRTYIRAETAKWNDRKLYISPETNTFKKIK